MFGIKQWLINRKLIKQEQEYERGYGYACTLLLHYKYSSDDIVYDCIDPTAFDTGIRDAIIDVAQATQKTFGNFIDTPECWRSKKPLEIKVGISRTEVTLSWSSGESSSLEYIRSFAGSLMKELNKYGVGINAAPRINNIYSTTQSVSWDEGVEVPIGHVFYFVRDLYQRCNDIEQSRDSNGA